MKKLLSIICTLAIVLGVVLVPGMFSASAAATMTELTVNAYNAKTTVLDGGGHSTTGTYNGLATAAVITFDYQLEPGAKYYITYDYMGHIRQYCKVFASVAASADSAAYAGNLVMLPSINNTKTAFKATGGWFYADDVIVDDNKTLCLVLQNTAETPVSVKNIKIIKATDDDYMHPVLLDGEQNAGVQIDADGNPNYFGYCWNGQLTLRFDQQIDPNKGYMLTYEQNKNNGTATIYLFANELNVQDDFSGDYLGKVTDFASRKTVSVKGSSNNAYNLKRMIFKGSDLVDAADTTPKYLNFLVNGNDSQDALYRNFKLYELPAEYDYPMAVGSATTIVADDTTVSYGPQGDYWGSWVLFNKVIDATKSYRISYQFKGHTWTSNNGAAENHFFVGAGDPTMTGERPAADKFVPVKRLDYASTATWIDEYIDVTGAELLANAPASCTNFMIYSKGFESATNAKGNPRLRNFKIVDLATVPADYSAVDAAIAAANALNPVDYVDFSAVTAAIDAVVEGKMATEQAVVDGYATAINEAVAALVKKPADYTAVDKAIEDANALNKDNYKDFAGVDAAVAAVVRDKAASEQAAVDAMAKAINDAIAALEVKDADYSAVNAAIAAAEALNPGDYNNWHKVARAIYSVKTGLKIDKQNDVNGYATAINDAIAALVEDDKYDYPINLGSDIKPSEIAVEEGTNDIVYKVPGSYGYKATLYFDVEMEAGKYYSITFNFKGDGKGAKGDWRVVGAADNWNGVNTVTQYDSLPNYRSNAIPRIDKNVSAMTEWGTVGMIVKADALINGDNKFIAISNGTTDGDGYSLVKNIVIEEVELGEGVLYPAAQTTTAKVAYEDGLVVGQFGSYDPSKISDYNYSYGRVFVAYDYTIEAGKTYKITYEYKGHNYSDVGKPPKFGVAKLDGISTGEDPAAGYVANVVAPIYGNQETFKAAELIVTGDELLANAPAGADKFLLYMGGLIKGGNFRNLKIVEATFADYTAVDAAIAAANALNKAHYVDFSAVDAAIAAVVRDKEFDAQAEVDAMAKAINDAVAALVKKGADYTAANAAKAAAEALDKDLYKDFSAVEAALNAFVTGKTIDQQADVDAMAAAINNAVAALEFKDADYSVIDELIETIDELDGDLYTNFADVEAAIAAVVRGKNITEQGDVDAMAQAIALAYAALEYKDADYSELDALVDAAEALDAEDYTNYDAVQEILDEITDDKNITEQDEVDAWAEALEAAIDALIERADYSEIAEIEAQYPDFNPADYTEESLAALIAVIEKLEANNNLPATEQDKVDELAEEFAAALKALVKKPVADNNDSKVEDKEDEKVEDNKTDKTPDKTGDSSNIVVAIAALAASVIGLAVLVIGKKRRA